MGKDNLAAMAPGRLSALLSQGLRGHHPLFDREAIVAAFKSPEGALASEDAEDVGRALLAMCREPISVARYALAALSGPARDSLIRLYFRLLDRAEEERRSVQ